VKTTAGSQSMAGRRGGSNDPEVRRPALRLLISALAFFAEENLAAAAFTRSSSCAGTSRPFFPCDRARAAP
jgi:hypothetical protein